MLDRSDLAECNLDGRVSPAAMSFVAKLSREIRWSEGERVGLHSFLRVSAHGMSEPTR